MIPLYEKGQSYIRWYCERCYPEVKGNIRALPWKDLYHFGQKGGESS